MVMILVNGDKLIGKFERLSDDYTIPKDSFVLKEILSNTGFQIIPLPFVQTTDKTVRLKKECVMVEPYNPTEELKTMFMKLTSNLLIPRVNQLVK